MRLRPCVSLPSRKLVLPCHRLVLLAGHHLVECNRLLRPWQVGDMPSQPCAFVLFAREALRSALEPCVKLARRDAPEAFRIEPQRAIVGVKF
jgi:hypothetical protein